MSDQAISMQEMCEVIERAGFLRKPDGSRPTALEIFRHDPNGELWRVFEWYKIATTISVANCATLPVRASQASADAAL